MRKVLYIPYVMHGYNAAGLTTAEIPYLSHGTMVTWGPCDNWNCLQPLCFPDAYVDTIGFIQVS